MILTSAPAQDGAAVALWVPLLAALAYVAAALSPPRAGRWGTSALVVAWILHFVALALDISGWGADVPGTRLGFAPVLSLTVWLVIALHAVESRFVPLPQVRRWLAPAGALVVALAWAFPGDPRQFTSALAPLHFVLGVGAYGLFGAAVVHASLLDSAERRLRMKRPPEEQRAGMPLLQLERLTFRLVTLGFVVLSAALVLGAVSTTHWQWTHKTVFSLLGWAVFAALLLGRRLRGWRGRHATRWLYTGAVLLLLAYVGYRFVTEVLLGRSAS
jgi:ABC-type uncharacterized transport system permease subunit